MNQFVADFLAAHDDDLLGRCETCQHHGDMIECDECEEGSGYCLDTDRLVTLIEDEARYFAGKHCGRCQSCANIRYLKPVAPDFIRDSVTCAACGMSGKFFTPAEEYEGTIRAVIAERTGGAEYDQRLHAIELAKNQLPSCDFLCDSEFCVLNPHGLCLYPLLFGGKKPNITDDGCDGCMTAD